VPVGSILLTQRSKESVGIRDSQSPVVKLCVCVNLDIYIYIYIHNLHLGLDLYTGHHRHEYLSISPLPCLEIPII